MSKFLLLFTVFIFTIACKNSEKSNSEDAIREKVEPASAQQTEQNPCTLLSHLEIKQALSIPEEAQTSMEEKNTTYPSCYYKWKSITWPYEVMKGHMADYTAEMSIVWVTDMTPDNYNTAVSYFKDGEEITGIGEMATWDEKKTQLTFLYNGNLMHVHARTSANAASNKAKALNVAELLVSKL